MQRALGVLVAMVLSGVTMAAQEPVVVQRPTPAPPAAQGRPAPPAPLPSENVRVDLTITDTFGSATPTSKTITMLLANGRTGRIRSSNDVRQPDGRFRSITINVDAAPTLIASSGRVLLNLTLEYAPEVSVLGETAGAPKPASINESITVLVADGKATMISQSADPSTDRKVTIEVTATVIR